MTPRGHCPVCHSRLGTSLTSCVCGWKMLDPMPRQDLELPPPVGFVLRAEHERLIAEKDTEIVRLREALTALVKTHDRENFMRSADFHREDCRCLRCAFDRARAALGDDND